MHGMNRARSVFLFSLLSFSLSWNTPFAQVIERPPSPTPVAIQPAGGIAAPQDVLPPPTVTTQFEGMSNTGWRPPDTHGAAGAFGVIAVVNKQVAYYAQVSGHASWAPVGFSTFWASAGNVNSAFDPHAI